MSIPVLSENELSSRIRGKVVGARSAYLAFYSSWFGGIVKDPNWMFVAVDDHIVHRGDGVFEAFKAVGRKVYALEPHLDRLYASMEGIGLASVDRAELRQIICDTMRAAGEEDLLARVYISRGPGGFTVDARECVGPQIYIAVTRLKPPAPEKYAEGLRLMFSRIPSKDPFFARIKSCNYLQNVLMKSEAARHGVDASLSIDADGYLGESSTENVAFVNAANELVFPSFARVLKGITLSRLAELARQQGIHVVERLVRPEELCEAREVFIISTTYDVMPVSAVDGHKIEVGALGRRLLQLLRADIANNTAWLTPL